jgi:hypothetical protein
VPTPRRSFLFLLALSPACQSLVRVTRQPWPLSDEQPAIVKALVNLVDRVLEVSRRSLADARARSAGVTPFVRR